MQQELTRRQCHGLPKVANLMTQRRDRCLIVYANYTDSFLILTNPCSFLFYIWYFPKQRTNLQNDIMSYQFSDEYALGQESSRKSIIKQITRPKIVIEYVNIMFCSKGYTENPISLEHLLEKSMNGNFLWSTMILRFDQSQSIRTRQKWGLMSDMSLNITQDIDSHTSSKLYGKFIFFC